MRGLVAAWCAMGPLVLAAQSVRDSAGVRIITYGEHESPPSRWTVDPRPMLVLGGSSGEGPSELSGVVGAVRLASGDLVIANGATSELRVFDRKGAFVRSIGRQGQGPGEFNRLTRLGHAGAPSGQSGVRDVFMAVDAAGRVQRFDVSGRLLDVMQRPRYGRNVQPQVFGILEDGAAVVAALIPADSAAEPQGDARFVVGLREPADETIRSLAELPAYEVVRKSTGVGIPGMRGYSPVFLGAVGRIAAGHRSFCTAYTAIWEVTCYSRSGIAWRTRRTLRRRPVTEADREAFIAIVRRMNPTMPQSQREALHASFVFAKQRPLIGQLMSTRDESWVEGGESVIDDQLWMGQSGRPSPRGPVTWSVLGRDGLWLADVTLPAGFFLLDTGPDTVTGVERDADDVERVVVYRLSRR